MSVNTILISKKECAAQLGISVRSVEYLIARRELPARRIGGRVLVPVSSNLQFAKQDHTGNLAPDTSLSGQSE